VSTIPPRFSLWIVPPGPLRRLLETVVARFAGRFDTPVFEPHVTVLGDLACRFDEARGGARAVAGEVAPFEVTFDGFGSDEAFFRAAYLHVRRTRELVRARCAAERIFADRRSGDEAFEPHLSLAYGSFDETVAREICGAASRRGLESASFIATRLTLAESSTTLPIERWRILEHLELDGPA